MIFTFRPTGIYYPLHYLLMYPLYRYYKNTGPFRIFHSGIPGNRPV